MSRDEDEDEADRDLTLLLRVSVEAAQLSANTASRVHETGRAGTAGAMLLDERPAGAHEGLQSGTAQTLRWRMRHPAVVFTTSSWYTTVPALPVGITATPLERTCAEPSLAGSTTTLVT